MQRPRLTFEKVGLGFQSTMGLLTYSILALSVPKHITRTRKDGHVRARDEGDESLLLDGQPSKKRKLASSQSQAQFTSQSKELPKSQRTQRKRASGNDSSESESETEPESDQEDLLLQASKKNATSSKTPQAGGGRLPTPPSREGSPMQEEVRPDGLIIGFEYPLDDFKKNIAVGDLVTKAVADLAFVIKKIVLEPLSGRRYPEMLQCLKELRKVASEVSVLTFAWSFLGTSLI